MLGRISSATEEGIRVRTQFFDQIFIPASNLPEGSELYVFHLPPFKYLSHSSPLLLSTSFLSHPARPPTFPHPLTVPSNSSEQLFVWNLPDSGQQLYYDNQETVRFRIEEEIWTDQSPMGPKEREDAAGSIKSSPYVVKGSMADAGLGPCLWWDGDAEEE